jgi:hypothetical protein
MTKELEPEPEVREKYREILGSGTRQRVGEILSDYGIENYFKCPYKKRCPVLKVLDRIADKLDQPVERVLAGEFCDSEDYRECPAAQEMSDNTQNQLSCETELNNIGEK